MVREQIQFECSLTLNELACPGPLTGSLWLLSQGQAEAGMAVNETAAGPCQEMARLGASGHCDGAKRQEMKPRGLSGLLNMG